MSFLDDMHVKPSPNCTSEIGNSAFTLWVYCSMEAVELENGCQVLATTGRELLVHIIA